MMNMNKKSSFVLLEKRRYTMCNFELSSIMIKFIFSVLFFSSSGGKNFNE